MKWRRKLIIIAKDRKALYARLCFRFHSKFKCGVCYVWKKKRWTASQPDIEVRSFEMNAQHEWNRLWCYRLKTLMLHNVQKLINIRYRYTSIRLKLVTIVVAVAVVRCHLSVRNRFDLNIVNLSRPVDPVDPFTPLFFLLSGFFLTKLSRETSITEFSEHNKFFFPNGQRILWCNFKQQFIFMVTHQCVNFYLFDLIFSLNANMIASNKHHG